MLISIRIRRKACEASSPSSSRTDMDSLPDGVVQHILSKLSNAKDIASCNCVSNKWKHLMSQRSYHKSLCFPSGVFENLTGPQTPDSIVMRMVSSVSRLEELVVSCPFTDAGLSAWLLAVGSSLEKLELHFTADGYRGTGLECLGAAKNLRSLCLWRVVMRGSPKWDVFQKLEKLEIHGARLEDFGFTEALCATPNLTRLVVTRCRGLFTVCIELLELRHCEYHVENSSGVSSLGLKAPKIQYLKVDGCNGIRVENASCLKTLSIYIRGSNVTMVELGDNLMALESLWFQGYRSHSDVISKILQLATQVKHLWVGDFGINHDVVPFPEIDFVDFFKSHPKLEYLDISGGIFDDLCNNHMTSIKNVDSSFVIPCLQEVNVTLTKKQTSNAKKKSRMIESLLKYGNKLKRINININTHNMDDDGASDFSKEIQRLLQNSTTESRVIRL